MRLRDAGRLRPRSPGMVPILAAVIAVVVAALGVLVPTSART